MSQFELTPNRGLGRLSSRGPTTLCDAMADGSFKVGSPVDWLLLDDDGGSPRKAGSAKAKFFKHMEATLSSSKRVQIEGGLQDKELTI